MLGIIFENMVKAKNLPSWSLYASGEMRQWTRKRKEKKREEKRKERERKSYYEENKAG